MARLEENSLAFSDDDSETKTLSTASKGASTNDSEIEFADVVEKLSFAIKNIRQLKPWKDRALKAERINRQLNQTVATLRDDLNDSEYEMLKWKKRAIRAEGEIQDEVLAWKKKAIKARMGKDIRDDDLDLELNNEDLLLNENENETFTNLLTERDDDESTISTFRDDTKSEQDVTGKSFRSKWNNLGFDEKQKPTTPTTSYGVHYDDGSTVAAQEIIQNVEKGNVFGSSSNPKQKSTYVGLVDVRADDGSTVAAQQIMQNYERGVSFRAGQSSSTKAKLTIPDDNSSVAAEEILNNYLNMKGRFSSRRFDTSSVMSSSPSLGQTEI
jgi:hypothetical protein